MGEDRLMKVVIGMMMLFAAPLFLIFVGVPAGDALQERWGAKIAAIIVVYLALAYSALAGWLIYLGDGR